MLLVENVCVVDAGSCAGRNGRAWATAVFTSCCADFRSVPSLNSTMTSDAPWLEVDWTVSTPLTPSMALTIGTDTWVSTISGEAPGSGVMTMTRSEERRVGKECRWWGGAYD